VSQQHSTCRNTSQHGGQTQATCYTQQCFDGLAGLKNDSNLKLLNHLPGLILNMGFVTQMAYLNVLENIRISSEP